MSDLDQLLTDAFERRAAAAPVSLSPEVVGRAIRRARIRTAKRAAGTVALVVLASAGAVAAAQTGHDRRVLPSSTASPSADWKPEGTAVATLPWGTAEPLTLRTGSFGSSSGETAEFCFAHACWGAVELTSPTITDYGNDGLVYGVAPTGTVRVLVTVGQERPLTAEIAGLPGAGQPVVFGAPGALTGLDQRNVLTQSVQLVAYGRHGEVLSIARALGTVDLAASHPAEGSVVSSPWGGFAPYAWNSDDGWTCLGDRDETGGLVRYGASRCLPPYKPDLVTLVSAAAVSQVAESGGTATSTEFKILRVPDAVSSLVLQQPGKTALAAKITDTGHGKLAVLSVDADAMDATPGGARSLSAGTLVGLDAHGATVFQGPVADLPRVPDEEVQVSGPLSPVR